jgi:hypothetical protein
VFLIRFQWFWIANLTRVSSNFLEALAVWVVDSPTNRASAEKVWAEYRERSYLDGLTVFKVIAERGPVEMLIEEMEAIDCTAVCISANPPYTVISVIGCELRPEVRGSLAGSAFNSFHRTSEGFEATRTLPPPLGE